MLFGILLAGVATRFAWQSRGLLAGVGIRRGTARAIRSIALAPPRVRDVGRLLSMYVRSDDAVVTMGLDFNEGTARLGLCLRVEGLVLRCMVAAAHLRPRVHAPLRDCCHVR